MTPPAAPDLDDALRLRLVRRFGPDVETWLDDLPPVLERLSQRWRVDLRSLISRGSFSVVIRCRTAQGAAAVLKISPDRRRVLEEARALAAWHTDRVPDVLAHDEDAGALLMAAVEPGTPVADLATTPSAAAIAGLLTGLHGGAQPPGGVRPLVRRIEDLYAAGRTNYDHRPEVAGVVPPELYERGRALALRLADDDAPAVLLHGDLTPVNVLDGGVARGLVAIDPAPCLGDPLFDAVDLLMWRVTDVTQVGERAARLGRALGADPRRMVRWCAAFAAMNGLEMAEAADDPARAPISHLLALAEAET